MLATTSVNKIGVFLGLGLPSNNENQYIINKTIIGNCFNLVHELIEQGLQEINMFKKRHIHVCVCDVVCLSGKSYPSVFISRRRLVTGTRLLIKGSII